MSIGKKVHVGLQSEHPLCNRSGSCTAIEQKTRVSLHLEQPLSDQHEKSAAIDCIALHGVNWQLVQVAIADHMAVNS